MPARDNNNSNDTNDRMWDELVRLLCLGAHAQQRYSVSPVFAKPRPELYRGGGSVTITGSGKHFIGIQRIYLGFNSARFYFIL